MESSVKMQKLKVTNYSPDQEAEGREERVGHKPGSVLYSSSATVEGGYLSGTPVTRRLKRLSCRNW